MYSFTMNYKVIFEIKNKKSLETIKSLQISLDALSACVNESWSRGVFPACLKSSLVIPIFKGGDLEDPSNYRPVSLLPTLPKVVEKLVKRRIWHYLQSFNLITDKQFGFQTSKGTHDAIFSFLEEVYFGLNQGETRAAV